MVRLQRLLHHAAMQLLAHLELFRRERSSFAGLLGVKVDGLGGAVIKSKAHILAVLAED